MDKEKLVGIIKSTLTTLKKKNIHATPINYAKEFSRQAGECKKELKEYKELEYLIEELIHQQNNNKHPKIDTYYELVREYKKLYKTNNLEILINNLEEIIAPSINHEIDSSIEKFVKSVKTKPSQFLSEEKIEELKALAQERIELDREVIKEKTSDIIKLTNLMGKYFDRSLIQSGNSLDEVNNIKQELDELELSATSKRELIRLQNKLVDTVYALGNNLKSSQEELIENKSRFGEMQSRIIKLQEELNSVRKEKFMDFLTGVHNRRAFDVEIEKLETQFKIFGNKYAILFIDIDYFKKINDQYGHECGDTILRTFANLLNALTREGDMIVRYGGEEFIALIKYEEQVEVEKYARRIKKTIEENNFVYKDLKFKIKFSAGVAYRENNVNNIDTVNAADSLMYKAKRTGREQIIFENGLII